MAKPAPRLLSVIRTRRLTPNMIRITLGGSNLAGFPAAQESAYVKLMFPAPERNGASSPSSEASVEAPKSITRSYTIRSFDEQLLEMELDFVAHGDNGPASAWAINAKVGDKISVAGPGAKKMADMSADWFFIAGDMTALPAISVNLEQMPSNARGYAVLEIIHESDKQNLLAPAGLEIHWVINPKPERPNSVLLDAVKSLQWLDGKPNVWAASEFESMRAMRRYFKGERGVGRGDIYASSYWKMGETDEGNKAAKRNDTDSDIN